MEHHTISHEFPEFIDKISELKTSDQIPKTLCKL